MSNHSKLLQAAPYRNRFRKTCLSLIICFLVLTGFLQQTSAKEPKQQYKTVTFASEDGLKITADLYLDYKDSKTPLIILCHQAGWSRGEYREIAPKLNKLGFNCIAIDQRSGGGVNGVENETVKRATKAKKKTTFVDAEQDILAAIKYARKNHAKGKVILWGSSYSAALVLHIAGENPESVDAVLSFSPGEYFARFGKKKDWITTAAKEIEVPVFITSAKKEAKVWRSIFEVIPVKQKAAFVPKTDGNHGSRALWKKFKDSKSYWKAVEQFLQQQKNISPAKSHSKNQLKRSQ